MYTTETSLGSDSIVARRQVSPNRYLVPGLSFEGGIFKEQQRTFVWCLILRDLALQAVSIQTHVVLVHVDHRTPKAGTFDN